MKPRKYDLDYALEKVFTDPVIVQETVDRLEEETSSSYVAEIEGERGTFLMRKEQKLTLVNFLGEKLCDGCEPEKGRNHILQCDGDAIRLPCKNAVLNVMNCMEDDHYSEHKIF